MVYQFLVYDGIIGYLFVERTLMFATGEQAITLMDKAAMGMEEFFRMRVLPPPGSRARARPHAWAACRRTAQPPWRAGSGGLPGEKAWARRHPPCPTVPCSPSAACCQKSWSPFGTLPSLVQERSSSPSDAP